MKKSFKAATIFAGVGAATGIFAPAALAAPMHVATATKPDIGPWRECGANNGGVSNWVHLYYPQDDHPAECIGGKGATTAGATIASECPGNNNGQLFGTTPIALVAGAPRTGWYGDKISGIYIRSWTGHAKCT